MTFWVEQKERIVKLYSNILAIGYCLMVLPIMYAGIFNCPRADDFSFGQEIHLAWMRTHSFLAVLKAAFQTSYDYFYMWQGTFSSIFLMSLHPGVINENGYKIVAGMFIVLLTFSVWHLLYTTIVKGYGQSIHYVNGIAALTLVLITQDLDSYVEGIYWYNASIHYTFGFVVMVFAIDLFLQMYLEPAKKKIGTAVLFAICCAYLGGSNLISMLEAILFMCFSIFVLVVMKKLPLIWKCVPGYVLLVAGSALNVLAPGNMARQNRMGVATHSVISTVLISFREGAIFAKDHINVITLFAVFLLLPLLVALVYDMGEKQSFKWPILLWLASYCMVSASFSPMVFSLGKGKIDRARNVIHFTYIVLLVYCLAYTIGWALDLLKKKNLQETCLQMMQKMKFPVVYGALGAVLLLGLMIHTWTYKTDYTSVSTMIYLINGEAQKYEKQCDANFELLKDENLKDVVLKRFDANPRIFLDQNDMKWENILWRHGAKICYGKDSVMFDFELEELEQEAAQAEADNQAEASRPEE